MFRKLLNSFRKAPHPRIPRTLYAPDALRGIDRLIEQVDRIWEANQRTQKSSTKPLGKTA